MRALNVVVVITLWIAVVALFITGLARVAFGQYDERTALALARCIRAECDHCNRHPDEQASMAWVLRKLATKRGLTLYQQTRRYCSVFKRKKQPRALAIQASTFLAPQHGPIGWWRRMERWVYRFLGGGIEDPTELAYGWGGLMDPKPGCMVEVRRYCRSDGKRCNVFYRYR